MSQLIANPTMNQSVKLRNKSKRKIPEPQNVIQGFFMFSNIISRRSVLGGILFSPTHP